MYELQFIDAVPLYGPTLRVHTEVGGDFYELSSSTSLILGKWNMSKKREIGFSNLTKIKPVTDNQELVFESWKKNKNQFF